MKGDKMKNDKTYTLDEICDNLLYTEQLDIRNNRANSNKYNNAVNAYTEALSGMDNIERLRKEAYAMKELPYPPEDLEDELCPGELEAEYRMIARRDKFRFRADGQIASYDLFHA